MHMVEALVKHWGNHSSFKDDFTTLIGLFTKGISCFVLQVPYFDNAKCIHLLQNIIGGLIHIMDDQARQQLKKTDHTTVEVFAKQWGNHSLFKAGAADRSSFSSLQFSHYNSTVTYSAEGFLDRNLDTINPDFISLL